MRRDMHMGPHPERHGPTLFQRAQHLGSDDLDVDLGGNLGVQTHGRLVSAQCLDRRAQLDAALVDLGATGSLDRRGDVGRSDGTEEPTGVAGADGQANLDALEAETLISLACSMVWISWILRARRICSTSFSPPLVQRIAKFRGIR